MNPDSTAIVLVDDDNDFLTEGGKLHVAIQQMLESNNVVSNINDLMNRAREKGVLVIHVPIMFSSNYQEMGEDTYGIFKHEKDTGAFQSNTWGAKVADVLEVQDSDIVVNGKSSTCAFATTDLRAVLDKHGIKTISLGGLLTNICIESTMRSAYDQGFEVYTLTDCSATLSEEQQRSAIEIDWPMFSKPVTHDEFLKALDMAPAA